MSCQFYCIGIDVSSATLDIHGLPGQPTAYLRLPNTATSHADLVARLSALIAAGDEVLVVMEASGGCERAAHHALAGIACAIVNPRRARDFARANGWLAKTDKVDARGLQAARCSGRARRRSRERCAPN
jgi:transposase